MLQSNCAGSRADSRAQSSGLKITVNSSTAGHVMQYMRGHQLLQSAERRVDGFRRVLSLGELAPELRLRVRSPQQHAGGRALRPIQRLLLGPPAAERGLQALVTLGFKLTPQVPHLLKRANKENSVFQYSSSGIAESALLRRMAWARIGG